MCVELKYLAVEWRIFFNFFADVITLHLLQRVSIACYAERCISHSKSVRLSV